MAQGSTLVVVDGHNLLNDVGRCLSEEAAAGASQNADVRHRYFRDWFDIDRLVEATVAERLVPERDLGIVVFHSRNEPGTGDWKMKAPTESIEFWARQGSNDNTSTRLISVEGIGGKKDGAVDVGIVVYLFETSARWDSVILFAHDSDYVPAVWSLRSQGKRVFCAARVSDRASPIVQACQHFYPWNVDFLRADRGLFQTLQPGGELDVFLQYQQVAARSPRVGRGLNIVPSTSSFGANDENTLNELLRPAGVLRASLVNLSIGHGITTCLGVAPIVSSQLIQRGLERHIDLFAGAHWHKLLE